MAVKLGPLDVQMSKADSLWEAQSSLAVYDAIVALQDKAYLAFERFFLEIENRSEGAITVRTAAEIASRLAIGLFRPLYGRIDPIHLGEAARALQVADHYGRRLVQNGRNFDPASLGGLITSYPSHGFVIDKQEAERVFYNVRTALDLEAELANALGAFAVTPGETPVVRHLSQSRESAGITDASSDAYPWSEEHDEGPDLRTSDAASQPASPGRHDAPA